MGCYRTIMITRKTFISKCVNGLTKLLNCLKKKTIGELFSTQRLAVLELGYGGEDLDPGPWWFGSPDDLAAGRHAVARHVTAAALGRPRAWGAPFWWYYLEDEAPGAAGGPVHEDLTQAAEHG